MANNIIANGQQKLTDYKVINKPHHFMRNLVSMNALADHLIRPPKFTYSLNDLGPSIFDHNSQVYERIDFSVPTNNDNKIQASLWKLKSMSLNKLVPNISSNILIYLHCNCGSRVEAMQFVNQSLELGYSFVAYDSRACGHSKGEYISLGYYQILDLEALILHINEHIVEDPQIVLWGRSMGAVTAMNYIIKKRKFVDNIKVAVLDSPFLNLKQVICQIVNKKIGAPKMLIDFFVSYLEPTVQQKAGFKISEFDLRNQLKNMKCPIILMASKSDGLVPFQHSQEIYETHRGRKSIFYLQQSHTDQRSNETICRIFKAINRYFLAEKKNYEQIPHATIKIKKLGGLVQLESFRSSEHPEQPTTASGKKNKKKISITYPQSMGKLETNRDSDFQCYAGKALFTNNKNSQSQLKKKKLSLNHFKTKSPCRYRPTLYLDQNKQKKIYGIQKTSDILSVHKMQNFGDFKTNRISSQMYQRSSNKQNSQRKKITDFSQLKREIRILNLKSNFD